MLEGLVAWVLNNYLGKYVENLNTDQLSIALLSGEVELENLPLRKDALRHLGLPVVIKSGSIGKIKLQIPVRQIRSAPWVINIEQMYVVASPLPVHEWDPLVEETAAQELKLSALDAIEARWRFEIEAKDNSTYYASTYSSWLSFGTGLITDIIENLQLRIKDVHIRYEDNFSIPNEVISFGLTMDYLSVQSCDANWVPGFLHWSSSTESYKILEMHKLAIYCLTVDGSQMFSKLSTTEIMAAMSLNQHSNFIDHYMLPPVSAEAHLKKNRSERPLRSSDTPRIVCNLMLQEVPLTLVDKQYNYIIKCMRGLQDVTRLRNYRQFRPLSSVKSDAKAWWLYAINCQYPDRLPSMCKPKPTWESCLERARQNVQYVKLYTKVLMTPAITLSLENKKLKDDIEWSRDYEQLKVLREIAMRAVPKQNSTVNGSSTGRSILVGWFPQWMGWYSNSNSETSNNNVSTDTAQLEDEILEALKDTAENNTLLKRDAIFGEFNFSLKSGSLRLCTTSESNIITMLELQYKNLSLHILSRPRTSSYLVELSLGGLSILDKLTLNSLFPILVGPPENDRMIQLSKVRGPMSKPSSHKNLEDSLDALFFLAYEQKPENSISDYRLNVRSKSLDVVYQPAAIKWLTEFLCFPHQQNITQMRIEAVKLRTKKELIKNWEQILDGHPAGRKNWELHLDVSAPQIIIVENFTDPNSAMAVIDFGRLQLQNTPNKTQIVNEAALLNKPSEEDDKFMTPCSTPPGSEASVSESLSFTLPGADKLETLDEESIHRKLYDCYCIEFTDLQVLIGRVKDNWRYAHNRGTSTLHVLDRFNISLQIEHRVVHTCDPLYPSLTVCANLPKLVAHLNEQKISAARGLIEVIKLTGLPSPFNTPTEGVLGTPVFVPEDEESISFDTSVEMSRLIIFQFTVDQLALEVQSRGRSIAELQVSGVKTAFSKRHGDDSITLSVHSLLLVDALQTPHNQS